MIVAGVDVGYMPSQFNTTLKGALVFFYYKDGKVQKSEHELIFKRSTLDEADMDRIVLEKLLAKKALNKADIVFMDGDLRSIFMDLSGPIFWIVKSPQPINLKPHTYILKPHPEKAIYFYRREGPVYRMETFPINSMEDIFHHLPPVSGYPSVLYEADRLSRIRKMDLDARELLLKHHRFFRNL